MQRYHHTEGGDGAAEKDRIVRGTENNSLLHSLVYHSTNLKAMMVVEGCMKIVNCLIDMDK